MTDQILSTLGGPERDFTAFEAWAYDTAYPLTRCEVLTIYVDECQEDVVGVLAGAGTAPDYYRLIRVVGDLGKVKIDIQEKYSRIVLVKPYYKLEPSGCTLRRGYIKVRFDFYLNPEDARYNERLITVPVFPKEPYTGTEKDYPKWIASLPTEQRLVPFHSHLFYCDTVNTDAQLSEVADIICAEAYDFWKRGDVPNILNPPLPPVAVNSDRIASCEKRIAEIVGGKI